MRLRDLATVTLVAGVPHMLVVHPSVPANNVKELIALAKQKPGKLSYSSAGVGSPFQIAAELFKEMAGVEIFISLIKGCAPAVADVIGHHVDMTFANLVAVLPQAKAGQVRALAVTSAKRSSAAPDVPTIAESVCRDTSFHRGSECWLRPARHPGIIKKLNAEIVKALRSPDITARLSAEGAELIAGAPEEFDTFLKSETAKWTKVIGAAGIQQIE